VSSEVDKMEKNYNNLMGIRVEWTGDTSKVVVSDAGVTNEF